MFDQHSTHRTSGLENLMRYNPYTASAGLSPEVIESAMRRAHVQRAQAASSLVAALGRGLRNAGRALLRGIARTQRQRAARLALRNLDPHLLADIGIERGQVRGLVDELLSAPPQRSRSDSASRTPVQDAPEQPRRAA